MLRPDAHIAAIVDAARPDASRPPSAAQAPAQRGPSRPLTGGGLRRVVRTGGSCAVAHGQPRCEQRGLRRVGHRPACASTGPPPGCRPPRPGSAPRSASGSVRSASSSGQIATTETSSGTRRPSVAQRGQHVRDGGLVVHHQAGDAGLAVSSSAMRRRTATRVLLARAGHRPHAERWRPRRGSRRGCGARSRCPARRPRAARRAARPRGGPRSARCADALRTGPVEVEVDAGEPGRVGGESDEHAGPVQRRAASAPGGRPARRPSAPARRPSRWPRPGAARPDPRRR